MRHHPLQALHDLRRKLGDLRLHFIFLQEVFLDLRNDEELALQQGVNILILRLDLTNHFIEGVLPLFIYFFDHFDVLNFFLGLLLLINHGLLTFKFRRNLYNLIACRQLKFLTHQQILILSFLI